MKGSNGLTGLEEHARRILAEGEKEAERIIAEAEKKYQEEVQKARTRAEEIIRGARERASAECMKLEKRERLRMEIETKKLMLIAKKDLLDSVLSGAMKRLSELPAERRRVLLGKILMKAREEIPNGKAYCRVEDQAQVRSAGYEIAGTIDSAGGVILESSDGAIRVDLRFETLLKQIWDKHIPEISAILFG